MGETQNQPFQLSFNASLKIDFQGSRVTSDGGLILVRDPGERLGLGELIEQHLTDSRRAKNTQFPFADLLRQSVYTCQRDRQAADGADFRDQGGRSEKSVGGKDRGRASFELWDSPGREAWPVPWPWGAPHVVSTKYLDNAAAVAPGFSPALEFLHF